MHTLQLTHHIKIIHFVSVPKGSECERLGVPYYGNQKVSASGRQCLRWDALPSSLSSLTDLTVLPDASYHEAANKCR